MLGDAKDYIKDQLIPFLLDLPLYNDLQRGVFKYTIILQYSTHLLNTLTPFPQVITQYSLPRFPLFSTPLGESSTPLLAPITVCQAMGVEILPLTTFRFFGGKQLLRR